MIVAIKKTPSTAVPDSPARSRKNLWKHPRRGLVFEFAARGVPVIHLLNIRYLAMKNGIPIGPIPIPPVGEGAVYYVTRYPKGLVWATLAISLIFLAAGKHKDGYSM